MTIAWSYSRLSDFEGCPLMFYHKNIAKTIKFEQNEAMKRGEKVHKELERNVIRTVGGQPCVGETTEPVWPIIKGFVEGHQEVMVEEKVTLDESLGVTGWFDKDAWLRCIFDLVGIVDPHTGLQNQVMRIFDWKTGAVRENDDQLRLCNMVAMLRWPDVSRVTSAFIFVDHKVSSKLVVTQRQDLNYLIDEFSDRAEAIQIAHKRGDWPAQKHFRCKWCKVVCQHAGG